MTELFENGISIGGNLFLESLPVVRQKFSKLFVWMWIDFAQNVFQVLERIDFAGFTGGNQAHEDGGGFAAAFAADK